MALALYRKYRPRTFAEVIGQEHVTEPLSQALRSGRLHHAYLFSGPRGCGKTSSARILARSLNCERGPTPEPCGVCESCRSLAPDGSGSIDVIEIDAASHGGVDDARELRERAFFAPASSRFKIYVIDEAHMVSTQGFNALLKLVEEPPDYVKFIFATTEPDKVLGTIKSRTHHYPFRLMPPGILRPYLEQLAEAEKVKVEPAVFPLVVRAGGGSARDTLSVLDQLIAGAGPEGVSYTRAVALLGVTDAALIDEMCDALAAGDGAAAYATIDRVAEAGHDPRRFASDLLERLRDLIVLQQVPDAAAKGLIDAPADQLERMAAQAQRLGPATLSRGADIVHNGLIEMRGTTAPRLLLELVTARMLLPASDGSALLQRLERMERRLTRAGDLDLDEADSDDDTGPAVLAASGPSQRPAASESDGGKAAAGGGAAAARAAAAAAASRARRGDSAGARTQGEAAQRSTTPPNASADDNGGPATPEDVEPAAADAGRRTAVLADDDGPRPPTADGAGLQPADAEPGPVAADTAGAARPVPPQAVMPDPATPEPVIPESPQPGALDAASVRRVWDELVAMVRRDNKRIAALASEATVRDVDGDTLVLTFRHAFHARTLAEDPEPVSDAAYEVLGSRFQLRCELTGDQRGDPAPSPSWPAGGRDSGGASTPPAGGQPPARERGPRERSSSGRGTSGGSDDRADDDHAGPRPDTTDPGNAHDRAPARPEPSPTPAAPAARPAPASAPSPRPAGNTATVRRAAATADDDDWPETVQPPTATVTATDDWPETAQLGGPDPEPEEAPAVPEPAPAYASAPAASATQVAVAPARPAAPARAPSSVGAAAAARAAARAAAGRGKPAAPAQAGPAQTQADADWAGEPPFDPEYDGSGKAAPAVRFDGFDPGDEPTDEVIDEKTARQSSEQQAFALLHEALGAERIGEIDLK